MNLKKSEFKCAKHVYLSSPTMHGEEIEYIKLAYETNWMSTVGENINELEKTAAKNAGKKYAVALCNCTSALHLCVILAAEKLYGQPATSKGALDGKRVFCSDMTFAATLNPVVYEGGIPVFIDTDAKSWNMDPAALRLAFEKYPDVKLVVMAHLYGFPGQIEEIRKICDENGALLIEDAAEAMGATVGGKPCGSFGDYSAISYNGNKIITGSSGGCLLTDNEEDAIHARKLSTQARDAAPWYQHSETGFNYRMSNVIAGVVRGQYPHLNEHIAQKKAIYERYEKGLSGLPIDMNPLIDGATANYWLSAFTIRPEAMCVQTRTDTAPSYVAEKGKSCPTEILEAIAAADAEGRPIWKPMHLQPVFASNDFVSVSDKDVSADIFERGLCLPSDNKMTADDIDTVISAIRACFD